MLEASMDMDYLRAFRRGRPADKETSSKRTQSPKKHRSPSPCTHSHSHSPSHCFLATENSFSFNSSPLIASVSNLDETSSSLSSPSSISSSASTAVQLRRSEGTVTPTPLHPSMQSIQCIPSPQLIPLSSSQSVETENLIHSSTPVPLSCTFSATQVAPPSPSPSPSPRSRPVSRGERRAKQQQHGKKPSLRQSCSQLEFASSDSFSLFSSSPSSLQIDLNVPLSVVRTLDDEDDDSSPLDFSSFLDDDDSSVASVEEHVLSMNLLHNPDTILNSAPSISSSSRAFCSSLGLSLLSQAATNVLPHPVGTPPATSARSSSLSPSPKKITLVLDLDETLVHSSTTPVNSPDVVFSVCWGSEEYSVYAKKRPHLEEFMDSICSMFEVIVFTASQRVYADTLLDLLDPQGKWFKHRLFRESCSFVDGNFIKDLRCIDSDLSKVCIIDNSPQAYSLHVENGIPISSWFNDSSDCSLMSLLPFLCKLSECQDVRTEISKKFCPTSVEA
eukprot:TRINITY_DN1940_c1_g1_i1.p1 TRINITY_DN1940_c1_g1~~TRINITY_DN1940_c1_g1_i1.p1  ORF type:complete len:502 (-),score=133.98 TRINITY_DN1940_c1_g1_i1:116-1621(-)